jgi:2-keto-4-pentenoate hydratase
MMQTLIDQTAECLRRAYVAGPLPPLRNVLEPQDIDGAYAVQSANTDFWLENGREVRGHKIGLTAKAVQQQLGVDRPDFGILFHDMQIADGGQLMASAVLQPKVEAEVAFILADDIDDPGATRESVAAAVNYAVAAIEIVDSRIADWKITFADTVADNGSSAFFVLADEPKPIADLDLWTCGMALEVDGDVVSVGAGAACLGHPLEALAWLARTLALRGGSLRKGDLVLSGALGPMVAIQPGAMVKASIGGLGSCGFVYRDDRK